MSYKIDFTLASSEQIEAALCKQLENIRLARNITQIALAKEAGISPRTVGRMEKGKGVSVNTFIRVLMALGIQHNLETLLPDPTVRPVDRVNLKGGERRRARPASSTGRQTPWRWGDGETDDE